jgi:hypothetical protein
MVILEAAMRALTDRLSFAVTALYGVTIVVGTGRQTKNW